MVGVGDSDKNWIAPAPRPLVQSSVMDMTVEIPGCPGAPGALESFLRLEEQGKSPLGENSVLDLEGRVGFAKPRWAGL